jgi:D-3-phosphoglycerate dehydrogenase
MAHRVINTQAYLTDEARKILIDSGCEIIDKYIPAKFTLDVNCGDEYSEAIMGADAVVAGGELYSSEYLDLLKNMKILARTGVGVDGIDLDTAARKGIWVTNTPMATAGAVSDFSVCLILSLLRNVPGMAAEMRAGAWNQFVGRELTGCTVGVVGTGAIGRATIKKLSGFDTRVIAFDIAPDAAFASACNFEYVELDALLAESDIVTLHVPHNPATDKLMDARRLGLMKPTASLVNTSRPGVIDKDALIAALQGAAIAGAAIDVHYPAPCEPNDPLVALDNVIATPWSAFGTAESVGAMCSGAASEIATVLGGGTPEFPVNQPVT